MRLKCFSLVDRATKSKISTGMGVFEYSCTLCFVGQRVSKVFTRAVFIHIKGMGDFPVTTTFFCPVS
jgi:hypothetical protein